MKDEEKANLNWFSRHSTIVKLKIALVGIFCIGIIMLFVIGTMTPDLMIPDDSSESKIYENEYLSFKYPKSFIDTSFFVNHDDKEYTFFAIFQDSEENGIIVSSSEIETSLDPTYLDEYYENLKVALSQKEGIKNFTLEKREFNGIATIKTNEEYDNSKTDNYGIFLTVIHDSNDYTFYFSGKDLATLESNYQLLKSSLKFK